MGPLWLGQLLPDAVSLQEPVFKSQLLSGPQLPHLYLRRLDSVAAKDPRSSDIVGFQDACISHLLLSKHYHKRRD